MKKDSELFEIEDRYCPICGNFVKVGTSFHRCSDKDIKKIFKEDVEESKSDRTYGDKLNEFDKFYNSDTYYDDEDTEDDKC
jgi:CRISPR/Cas system-associated protein Cas10 (large subunit of type III CRISPR-Cas system)